MLEMASETSVDAGSAETRLSVLATSRVHVAVGVQGRGGVRHLHGLFRQGWKKVVFAIPAKVEGGGGSPPRAVSPHDVACCMWLFRLVGEREKYEVSGKRTR